MRLKTFYFFKVFETKIIVSERIHIGRVMFRLKDFVTENV